ncbi:MAG: tetratricopeptide repeat protein [Bacteroidia bacterium]
MIKKHTLIFLVLGLIFSSCGTSKSVAELPYKKKKQFEELYHEAAKNKLLNNTQRSIDLFQQALKVHPRSHACMYQLAGLYYNQKKYVEAEEWARKSVKYVDYNYWYSGQLAQIYYQLGKYEESAEVFQSMIANEPNRSKLYMEGSNQYLNASDPKSALDLLDLHDKRIGVTEETATKKEYIYLKLGKADRAVEAIQALVEAYPEKYIYKGYLAETLINVGRGNEALVQLEELSAIDSSLGSTEMLLYELYTKKGEELKGYIHLKRAFRATDIEINKKLEVFTPYYLGMRSDPTFKFQAIELSDILMEVYPDLDVPYVVKGDIYNSLDSLELSRNYFAQAVLKSGADYMTWNKLLSLDSKLGNSQWQLEDSEAAIARFPNIAGFYLAKAYAYLDLEQYTNAVSTANEGLEIATAALDKMDFWSCLASAYNELKEYHKVDEFFEKALQLDPENKGVLNNYAFSLAERGVSLEKAMEMINRAMATDLMNPYFKDTKAWILYKQGKSDEAIKLLLEAIELDSRESEYFIHLAEIYLNLGKVSEAQRYLDKARELGSEIESLDELT